MYVLRILLSLAIVSSLGCRSFERLAVKVIFKTATLPAAQEIHDIAYVSGDGTHDEKHRLDLFLPAAEEGWPTLIFVHGGSWLHGDRNLTFGGEEIYGNIGRFYANRGLGVAVISYRLRPEVTWREQVDDVAAAVAWVSRNIETHGGNPRSIFLSGHSAGAQLSSFAVASGELLGQHGVDLAAICGVVSVSGAGLDLADPKTYELGADAAFYENTFHDVSSMPDGEWQRQASATSHLGVVGERPIPPWLIFFAGKEHALFERQASLLREAVVAAGSKAEIIEIPKASHKRIVAELSQPGSGLDEPVLAFVEANRDCAQMGRSAP